MLSDDRIDPMQMSSLTLHELVFLIYRIMMAVGFVGRGRVSISCPMGGLRFLQPDFCYHEVPLLGDDRG